MTFHLGTNIYFLWNTLYVRSIYKRSYFEYLFWITNLIKYFDFEQERRMICLPRKSAFDIKNFCLSSSLKLMKKKKKKPGREIDLYSSVYVVFNLNLVTKNVVFVYLPLFISSDIFHYWLPVVLSVFLLTHVKSYDSSHASSSLFAYAKRFVLLFFFYPNFSFPSISHFNHASNIWTSKFIYGTAYKYIMWCKKVFWGGVVIL